MGTLRLGEDAEDLEVTLRRDQGFFDTIRLEAGPNNSDGLPEGTPIDWPAGTLAWLQFKTKGTSRRVRFDAVLDGPYMRFDSSADEVNDVTRDAKVTLWIHYVDEQPFVFAAGSVEWVS